MRHKEEIIDTECVDGIFEPKNVITIETEDKVHTVQKEPIIQRRERTKIKVPIEVLDFVDGFNTSLSLIGKLLKGR